jgi:hypothetical protein
MEITKNHEDTHRSQSQNYFLGLPIIMGILLICSKSKKKIIKKKLSKHPVRPDKSVEDWSKGRPGCKSST